MLTLLYFILKGPIAFTINSISVVFSIVLQVLNNNKNTKYVFNFNPNPKPGHIDYHLVAGSLKPELCTPW